MRCRHLARVGGCAAFALSFNASASCGSAFCLVNTDWPVQGVYTDPGTRFDLRFESVTLDQPRMGKDEVAFGQFSRHHDELETKNRNWIAMIERNFDSRWGLALTIPYVDRDHIHIHNHRGEKLVETWAFRELGDMRATARYEFTTQDRAHPASHAIGGLFGLKLPTGKYDVTNGAGAAAERSLQPGTGTTDLILGLYANGETGFGGTTWFTQAGVVLPLNERAGYKPGRQFVFYGGERYSLTAEVGLMAQVNYQARGRDSGAEAEPEDSGQHQLFFTPGLSWTFSRQGQVYAFAQVPLYQSVNGVQLTADSAYAVGVSWRF